MQASNTVEIGATHLAQGMVEVQQQKLLVWNAMTYDRKFNQCSKIQKRVSMERSPKIQNTVKENNFLAANSSTRCGDTGEYRWHYQSNPGETWDYDTAMDMELAELVVDGHRRSIYASARQLLRHRPRKRRACVRKGSLA